MLECRDHIEHQIGWHPKMGSSLFWFKNWAGLGDLYLVTPPGFYYDETVQNVGDVVQNDTWSVTKLHQILPQEIASHIIDNILPPLVHDVLDKPLWMLKTRGQFSVKSTWEYLRKRKEPCNAYKMI